MEKIPKTNLSDVYCKDKSKAMFKNENMTWSKFIEVWQYDMDRIVSYHFMELYGIAV